MENGDKNKRVGIMHVVKTTAIDVVSLKLSMKANILSLHFPLFYHLKTKNGFSRKLKRR
jgi:hypothetical protein